MAPAGRIVAPWPFFSLPWRAVVGFDDFMLADLLEPGVTVVAQDPREMGHLTAEILFRRLEHSSEPVRTHVVPCRLLARGSGEIAPSDTRG